MKVLSALIVLILSGCSHLFYYPSDKTYYTPKQFNLQHEDVWIDVDKDTKIHGWLLKSKTQPTKGTILFFHGNAENITSHFLHLAWLPEQGYEYLIFDYPGYGKSPGKPTAEETVKAGSAALKWLHKYDSRPLIVYGQSLGGAVAQRVVLESKSEIPIKAVVLDSTFTSYRGIAKRKLRYSWITWALQPLTYILISDKWKADDISQISPIPVLVIHGQMDRVVEPEFGDQVFEALKEPKEMWKIEKGQHTDVFWAHEQQYRPKFVAWLSSLDNPEKK